MKFSLASLAVVALATQTATADWFGGGNAVYNKWHETELERWLNDHNVPYPTASDRKSLQNLVSKNWDNNVVKPYNSWDTNQLSSYLSSKGYQAKKGTEKNKDSLIEQVGSYWHSTADQANEAASDVKSYIFDSWTESQLKAFLDYHGISNPSPRTRDSLLHTARSNYQSAANKAGETFAYPGDWLYSQWSDSDLKAWLVERGIPAPQPGTRDKLIASMRRNAYLASKNSGSILSSVSKSAVAAQATLSDQLLNSWSDSKLKEWLDSAGIPVPQGSKKNELVALARKHSNQLAGSASSVSASGASAFGAATSSAGNYYAQATANSYGGLRYYVDYALNQVGIGSKEAKASLSSVSASVSSVASVASSSLSSAALSASSSASSLASVASKSASSASSSASKHGGNPLSAASAAAREVSSSASSAASVLSSSASVSSKSAASVASKSSKSAASVASVSAKSASAAASSSASSASSVASKSSSSASVKASSSASSLSSKASASASSASSQASLSASSKSSSSISSSVSSASSSLSSLSSSLSSASSSAKKEL